MRLEWSDTVEDQNSMVFPLQRFVHQLLGNAHQSFSKPIALWIVWAAGDVVHLIEIQEVVKFPRTVARSFVRS